MELVLFVTDTTTGGVAPLFAPVAQVRGSFRYLQRAVSTNDSTVDGGIGSFLVGGANILSRWRQWQLGSFHLTKAVQGQTVAAQGESGYQSPKKVFPNENKRM